MAPLLNHWGPQLKCHWPPPTNPHREWSPYIHGLTGSRSQTHHTKCALLLPSQIYWLVTYSFITIHITAVSHWPPIGSGDPSNQNEIRPTKMIYINQWSNHNIHSWNAPTMIWPPSNNSTHSPGLKNLRQLLMRQQRHPFRWRFQVAHHVHGRASGTVAVSQQLAVACTAWDPKIPQGEITGGSVDCHKKIWSFWGVYPLVPDLPQGEIQPFLVQTESTVRYL